MPHPTYDPIVTVTDLPALRLLTPLRSPDPGQALVLVPHSGPAVTILPGGEVPAARFGTYRQAITVDTADRRLDLDLPLLSRDHTFAFRGRVTVICRVADPVAVVERGVRDVAAYLAEPIRGALRRTSRNFDIAEFHEAEQALDEAAGRLVGDKSIELRSVNVELLVDDDETATSGRAYRDIERASRLKGTKRRHNLDMLRTEGVEGLLADLLESKGEEAVMDRINAAEVSERAELFNALKMVLERGDAEREPFEVAEMERAVVDRVLGGSAAPFGGSRGSRVRGSLAPAAHSSDDTPPPRDSRTEPLRGKVLGSLPAGPPEDEPVGPATPWTPPPAAPAPESGTTPARATPDASGAPSVSRVRGVRKPGDRR